MRVVSSSMSVSYTVNLFEILWTAFSTGGLIFTGRLLYRAVGDLFFLKARGVNHFREFAATTTVWQFAILEFIQFIYVLIGGFLMAIPSPAGQSPTGSILIGAVFISTTFMFTTMAFIVDQRKEHLIDMVKEELDGAAG